MAGGILDAIPSLYIVQFFIVFCIQLPSSGNNCIVLKVPEKGRFTTSIPQSRKSESCHIIE
jgi:hypothetical protein